MTKPTLTGELSLRPFFPWADTVSAGDVDNADSEMPADARAIEAEAKGAHSLFCLSYTSLALAFNSATLKPFLMNTTMD